MKKCIVIIFILLVICELSTTQTAATEIPITITENGGGNKQLYFGLDIGATDGIDTGLGESELPPVPPAGVFDARFIGDDIGISIGQGLEKDYREGGPTYTGTKIHEIKYQVGSGTEITISWDLPSGVSGNLQDLFGGVVINTDMNGSGSTTITNPGALDKLKMTINYSLDSTQTITLTSPNGGEEWQEGSQHNITWTSEGVTDVKIDYSTNNGVGWLSVESSITANEGSYLWTIPNTPSTNCKVKISDALDSSPLDESDGTFTIVATNLSPVVDDIPDQTINEGESFETINLDDYVNDPDNADNEITWTYSGNTELIISIDVYRVVTIVLPSAEWSGSETITFTATDPNGGSDNDQATFTKNSNSLIDLEIPITITENGGGSKQLYFGLDLVATDGIDTDLGESELPPVPPAGVFDARFIGDDLGISIGQGLEKDYREGGTTYTGTKIHEIKYQVGGGTEITISWDLPSGVSGNLQDLFGGVIINKDMNGSGSITITNPGALDKLKMTINYSIPLSWTSNGEMIDQIVYVGNTLTHTYQAVNSGQDAITYLFNGNHPNDALLNINTGEFSWAPLTASAFPAIIKVLATDGIDTIDTQAEIIIKNSSVEVSGTVTYNISGYPLSDAYVSLYNGSALVASDTTDINGSYWLENISTGIYTLRTIKTTDWGGSLSSDALETALYTIHGDLLYLVTDMQKTAADVDGFAGITAGDALMILKRSVNLITAYAIDDWQFEGPHEITVGTSNVTQNVVGIAAGDARSDYNPNAVLPKYSLAVNSSDVLKIKKAAEFEMPISVSHAADIGSFTLKLRYPEEKLEFVGIRSNGGTLVSNVVDGVIQISWADFTARNSMKLDKGDAMAYVSFRATELFSKNEEVSLEVIDGSEITDRFAKSIDGGISVPTITVGIPDKFALNQNYPKVDSTRKCDS